MLLLWLPLLTLPAADTYGNRIFEIFQAKTCEACQQSEPYADSVAQHFVAILRSSGV